MDNQNNYLEDWVFHFSSLRNQWAAIPRELYKEYWNDYTNPEILRSANLQVLLDLLHKVKGESSHIKKILE